MVQIKSFSFSLYVLATLIPATMAMDIGKECLWKNTNYLGFTVKKLANIPTADCCQTECTDHANENTVNKCRHWSWDPRNKTCFLKLKSKGRVSAITEPFGSDPNSFSGWVSGPRKCKCVHKNLIFNGKQVGRRTVDKAKKCLEQCKNLSGCLNFSWSRRTKECKLLAKITSVAFAEEGRSGPQSCNNEGAEEDDSEEEEEYASYDGAGEYYSEETEEENQQYANFQKTGPVASVDDVDDLLGSSSGISIMGFVLAMFFSF